MAKKTGPYLRSPVTIESVMKDVLYSLIPALAAGVIFFGIRALWVVLLSTLTAMVTEMLFLRQPINPKGLFGDGSAAVTGVLVGLILPSTTAWWIPIVGSFLAIALVKLPFGGLGHNIFNPALGARAILLLAFTSEMVRFVLPFDTVTGATPLLSMTSFNWSLIWGNVGGSIGETSVIAILLGAAYLLYKGHIDWRVPTGYVGAAFLAALLWGLNPWITIFGGGLLFAAVFMATDMVTSPVTPTGQLVFGIGCGLLTVFIRKFTSLPEGVTFAVLVMNALVPLLDRLTVPQIFGVGVAREQRFQGTALGAAVLVVVLVVAFAIGGPDRAAQPVISGGHYLPIAELLGTTDYEIEDINGTRYYTVRDGEGNLTGAAFVGEQRGFNGSIRYLIALDDQYAVQDLIILEHKEDPGLGARITQPAFLQQFVGLGPESKFEFGTDIDGLSGATISSRAVTTGIRRSVEGFMNAFFPSQDAAGGWADGTYTGEADSFGGKLAVEVTVSGGKITAVEVVSHSDTPGISDPAINTIPGQIVAANSPTVDAISGATFTSEGIMQAVQNALVGAEVGGAPGWADGTYTGEASSFGGKLAVEVTVSGGKITAVEVVSHSDTPGISDPAINTIPGQIVAANSPQVDAISGATYTSEGIMAAVENALAGAMATASPAAAPKFDIQVADGTYRAAAQGRNAQLVAEVTVSGGKIAGIAVVEHAETPDIGGAAIEKLVPAIVEAQSPVDAISGATMTSQALFEAVAKAVSGAGQAAAAGAEWLDGTYTGTGQGFEGPITVEVTVSGGKIAAVNVKSHSDTPGISDGAVNTIPGRIVEANSPQVDAVSGATYTSKGIMEAVENALAASGETAAEAPKFDIQVADGTYKGVGQGFGGDVVVEVTVAGGKIASIQVVEHSETPFVAGSAIDKLVPAMVEAQGPVDAYSGATMTSEALFAAVAAAVSGEEGR
jgi:RnfABCDGE-type electron transport complex D subunit